MKKTSFSNTIHNNESSPDAYMINASYLRTNELGQQEIVLFAPLVNHYQHQNSSLFQHPKIELYKNGQKWLITSNQAKGINGVQTFYLQDNVIIKQLPSSKNATTTLSTSSLTVFPKKELVTTKELVTIEQPGLKIRGKGLIASLKDGSIQLLSSTRGQYDPKKSH